MLANGRFALALVAAVVLGNLPKAVCAEPLSASELERQVMAVYERVRPAIVSVDWTIGKVSEIAKGIIVSADGHILLQKLPANAKVSIQFADGRSATGTSLGSSAEWDLGLAKIDGSDSWPHVELGDKTRSGQGVVTLAGRMGEKLDFLTRPLLGLTSITGTNGSWFLMTDYNMKADCFAFDLNGHLIGGPGVPCWGHGTVHVEANVIRSLWEDLLHGKDRDSTATQSNDRAVPISKDVVERATAASVQIRRQPNQKGWSGTIISKDGLIATCAHHFVMPGTKVVVSLRDGRDVEAKVLGISFPCDVGLV
jgi:S1-C subfamily serine protease